MILSNEVVKAAKIGDVIMTMSYGSAKTWSKVVSITFKQDRKWNGGIIKDSPYRKVIELKSLYYKCGYDRHLTGRRSDGVIIMGLKCRSNWPMNNCKRLNAKGIK